MDRRETRAGCLPSCRCVLLMGSHGHPQGARKMLRPSPRLAHLTPGPHPSQRAELEATMAASNLEAVSPPRQRGAASNPHPLVCFYFIPRSLSLPHQEVIFNTILLTGLLGDYVKHLEQSLVRSKCHSYWFHKGNSAFIEVRNRVPSFIHSAVLLSIYSDNQ